MKALTAVAIAASLAALAVSIALVAAPPRASAPASARSSVELASFLPRNPATDGTVDYTANVQRALDAAAGRTLRLAPFPVLVSPPPGANACLVVRASTRIEGSAGSRLVTRASAVQLLRCENADGIALEGFALEGAGGAGRGLGHGLVQIWRCNDVRVEDLAIADADADALAIAEGSRVRVEGCAIERASKAGIYLARCADAVVASNVVRGGVGHVAPNGDTVGAAILLLSCRDAVCSSNVVDGGVGAGILVGALDGGPAPDGVSVVANRVRGVSNPSHPGVSSGIQLANGASERRTHVAVLANSIRACGQHGILLDDHDGALIQGNSIEESALSAISVANAEGVLVLDNAVVDANTSASPGQAGVYLHSTARQCVARGNEVVALDLPALPAVIDRAPAGSNRVE